MSAKDDADEPVKLLLAKDVAALLNVSTRTVARLVASGKLRGVRMARNGRPRFFPKAVAAYQRSLRPIVPHNPIGPAVRAERTPRP